MKKLLYIVLDGLGDLPNEQLGGKTPLQAAETRHLDELARKGKTGLVYPVGKGIAPESDIAVISILGYDAHKLYTGRGPLESFAAGLEVNDGNLAWRVNFATLGREKIIVDRRVGRSLTTAEATELCKAVNSGVKLSVHPARFEFKNTVGHRGVLVIRADGTRLSARVTNLDPAYGKEGVFGVAKEKFESVLLDCEPEPGFENDGSARLAAALTNEFVRKSHEILESHPVNKKRVSAGKLAGNLILARDAGDSLPKFPKIGERFGMKFGSLVEMPVERGIAILTGMEIIELPLPTGNPDRDYPLRAEKVLAAMNDFDSLYIHLKGPDEPAHDGDAGKKRKSIEDIDRLFFGNLLPGIDREKTVIAVTADHSTPCSLKAHSADPVPFMVSGAGVADDGSSAFSEETARRGSMGELIGQEIMPLLSGYCQD